jgi:ATP-binding cassette, subfamily B, bacterial
MDIGTISSPSETDIAAPNQAEEASPTELLASANPESVASIVSDETIKFRLGSDIDLDGNPAQQYLLVSPSRMVVARHPDGEMKSDWFEGLKSLDQVPPESVLTNLCLGETASFRTVSGTGSGQLQAKVDGSWRNVLRFSNALADPFHSVCRRLESMKKPGDEIGEEIPIEAIQRCKTCQLRLPPHVEHCPRCLHHSQILGRVWDLVKPQIPATLLLCALTLAGVAAELVPPKLQQYMVDHILADHSRTPDKSNFFTALLVVVLALAGSRVFLSVVSWFKGRLATRIGATLTYNLRAQMVERLQKLTVAYYDRHQAGSLMSRVAYDSEVLQGLLHQITGGFLLQILQLFGVGAMLIWLNPKLAIYTLIPVPLVVFGTMYFWRHVYPRYYRLWDSSSKQIGALSGMLSGIRVVKAFAQEDREFQKYNRANTYLRDSRLWVDHATSTYSATMGIVFSLGGLIVWYVGGRDVIGQSMSLGELIAFLAYLAMFYAPLATLSTFTTWLTSFLTGSKRVMELLDTPITIHENPNARQADAVRGAVEFDNVTFGYDRHQPVIQGVSFSVAPGEMVGIVGRSGSGKTTMINLLGRFYDVHEGRILVDGVDIRDYSMSSLRQNIGIVFQDSFMFRGTIWDNLTYGKADSTPYEALQAAKAAGAHDFICRSALGYETALGENGSGLSGGEKQRLSIARTLLYDPKILVLDEATSNIDAEAEKAIQSALQVLVKGRTTIAIAHRLSTLRNADRIIVFDRGRLIEQGSHAELLKLDGTYARLVKLQTQISKDPNVDKLVNLSTDAAEEQVGNEASAVAADIAQESDSTETISPSDSQGTVKRDAAPLARVNLANATFLPMIESAAASFCEQEFGNLELTIETQTGAENGSSDSNSSSSKTANSTSTQIDSGDDESVPAKTTYRGVFVVACFPASEPEAWLSVRAWNEKDEEIEIGIIRSLSDWPADQQTLIRRSISQRYLLPRLSSIESIENHGGYLDFVAKSNRGPAKFTIRWSQSQAVDFGSDGTGKLLIDTEDNRYVISDVELLPKTDRERFRQYIYW